VAERKRVKKKIEVVDGQEVAQDIQNAKFVRVFNKWKNGDGFEFLVRHGIGSKRSNTTFKVAKGHANWLPRLVDIASIRGTVGAGDIEHLENYVKFLEGDGGKGTIYDPSMILFHEKVYDEDGKFREKRPVYGHWRTKYKTQRAKGKYGSEAKGQYSYDKKHNPKHNIANSIWGNGQLLDILKDGIEELKNLPTQIKVRRVSDVRKLLQFPQVKAHLESLLTSNYFTEGKMKPSSIINAIKGKVFELDTTQEKLFREITGLSEDEVEGDIEFILELSAPIVERIYMASSKKKAGGFFIHGKTMDKRPRKDGEIISKMWMELFV